MALIRDPIYYYFSMGFRGQPSSKKGLHVSLAQGGYRMSCLEPPRSTGSTLGGSGFRALKDAVRYTLKL